MSRTKKIIIGLILNVLLIPGGIYGAWRWPLQATLFLQTSFVAFLLFVFICSTLLSVWVYQKATKE